MRHEASRDLFRYWNEVREPRASPERDDIDPGEIRNVLADTFILEARRDGTFPLRLSGTRVDALWLANLRDHCFLDLWGDDRHSIAAALWTVMDGTSPVILAAKAKPRGRPEVSAEALLLPLRHHGRTHSLVLGALSIAQPPSWIGLVPIEKLRLVSLRVIMPEEAVRLPVLPHTVGTQSAPQQRHGHLTVYAGGRGNHDHP